MFFTDIGVLIGVALLIFGLYGRRKQRGSKW